MKFQTLLEELLIEASPAEIYQKYYNDIAYVTFVKIVSNDPMSIVNGQEVKRIGRYTKILLSLYRNNRLQMEDLEKAKEYLTYVYKHNVSIDINKITSISDIYNLVKRYMAQDKKELSVILESLGPDDYSTLMNGDEWYIFHPKTEKGSCYLGVNTQWCTTYGPYSLNPSYRERDNYFNNYNKQGPLYIMINKKNENSKYQFHFNSKQYMDPADRQISTGDFLSENIEIRNYFFPSLVKETDATQKGLELDRLSILSTEDSVELIRKTIDSDGMNNTLVAALLDEDENIISNLIIEDNLDGYTFKGGSIVFEFTNIDGDLEDVERVVSYYKNDLSNSWERVYDDFRDRVDDWSEELNTIFENYYKENVEELKSGLGVTNLENFKRDYLENFANDNTIREEYIDESARLSASNYESECQNIVNEMTRYIDIDSRYRTYDVSVNIAYFIQFILSKKIEKIDDLSSFLDDYISHYDVMTEYEGVYEYNMEYASYEQIKNKVDGYFDELIEGGETTKECVEYRKKLNTYIEKLLNGSDKMENDHISFELKSTSIDCGNASVEVYFTNKDTGKTYQGPIKVDSIPSYVTNYPLFESLITFKKNTL
jgi:hypothetical protein